jgi:hypothetical protein
MTTLTVDRADDDGELRALAAFLRAEPDLRGGIQLVESPPAAGHLGPVLDAVEVAAQPAAAVLVSAVVAWARSRRSHIRVRLDAGDGRTVDVDARQLTTMDAEAVGSLIERLSRQLDADPADPDRPAAPDPSARP